MTSTQAPTTSGFRQIFSSDDVGAYIRQGRHGWTVVLFESAGLVGRGHEAPRRGFIEEADLSVVLIKAHRRNWYPQKVMLPCLEAVLTHAAGICMTNNAAERALRGVALGRKSWLFAGTDRGGERAAAIYSLIVTVKLNGVEPRAWLADVLGRIANHSSCRLSELLPWNWRPQEASKRQAA